jgi:hypothetical protein
MAKILKAQAIFDWVDRPTMLSGVTGYTAFPNEVHEVFSDDSGETWYVNFGIALPKKWVILTTTPAEIGWLDLLRESTCSRFFFPKDRKLRRGNPEHEGFRACFPDSCGNDECRVCGDSDMYEREEDKRGRKIDGA